MVGFIKGLLGAKQTAKTDVTPAPEAAPKPPKPEKPNAAKQPSQAFYLDTADAKTLGDIDYMQAAREIRRSFPKTAGGEELRTVSVVSSLQRSRGQSGQAIAQQQASLKVTAKATTSPTFAPQSTPVSGWTTPKADNLPKLKDPKERRREDSNLDTFRAMARDIQKSNARR